MSPKVLNLILKALDANGEAVFGREELAAWPRADIKEALRSGLLERVAPADEVVCPGCEEACLEDVEFVHGDTRRDTRAYVVCGQRADIGRVPILLRMLDRWAVNSTRARSLVADSQAFGQHDQRRAVGALEEGGLYPYLREQWEQDDAARISNFAGMTATDLLADCNRMIHCIAGFTTVFGLSPDGASRMAREIDEEWLAGFNRTDETLCLAAVSRSIDLEPFKELSRSAYSFWTGSLPRKETEDAINRLYHPGIAALFNLKRALMVQIAQSTGPDAPGHNGQEGKESSPVGALPMPKKPSRKAIACFRVHIALGQPSQDQTAQALAKEWGKVVHQGTVSRWVRDVDAWLKAGNVLPDIELADNRGKPKPTPADPSRLELGRRTDHKRQHRRSPLQE
jgi:hypothetical protein